MSRDDDFQARIQLIPEMLRIDSAQIPIDRFVKGRFKFKPMCTSTGPFSCQPT